jgi:hypothetical protein
MSQIETVAKKESNKRRLLDTPMAGITEFEASDIEPYTAKYLSRRLDFDAPDEVKADDAPLTTGKVISAEARDGSRGHYVLLPKKGSTQPEFYCAIVTGNDERGYGAFVDASHPTLKDDTYLSLPKDKTLTTFWHVGELRPEIYDSETMAYIDAILQAEAAVDAHRQHEAAMERRVSSRSRKIGRLFGSRSR